MKHVSYKYKYIYNVGIHKEKANSVARGTMQGRECNRVKITKSCQQKKVDMATELRFVGAQREWLKKRIKLYSTKELKRYR